MQLLTPKFSSTLAPVASIARLAYQIPNAKGKDTTVIYMIVVFLAISEQVIAMVAGNAPVVSAWVVRKMRRGKRDNISPAAAANKPRTLTERFWPNREGDPESPRERRRKWKHSGGSDPYPITITTMQSAASQEALDPRHRSLDDNESGPGSEAWELGENVSVPARTINTPQKVSDRGLSLNGPMTL